MRHEIIQITAEITLTTLAASVPTLVAIFMMMYL